MSNRFHNKYHRHNHHTDSSLNEADSSHDPIASPADPFKGSFILAGALSASAPASAYAGLFVSNNAALCAIGSTVGLYVSAPTRDTGNIDISGFVDNSTRPLFTYPAIIADGNVLVRNAALSASTIWTDALYAVSAVIQYTDMVVTELSGFTIKGTDTSLIIPSVTPTQLLLLNGVGISGSQWAEFDGNIQTRNNLIVSGGGYIEDGIIVTNGNLSVNGSGTFSNTISTNSNLIATGNLSVSGNGYIEDGLTINNGNLLINGSGTFSSIISTNSNLIATGNLSVSGSGYIEDGLTINNGNLTINGNISSNMLYPQVGSSTISAIGGLGIFGPLYTSTNSVGPLTAGVTMDFVVSGAPNHWHLYFTNGLLLTATVAP